MKETRPAPRQRPLCWLIALGLAGCATFGEQGQSLVPTRYQTRTGPYAVLSNFSIAADSAPIKSLQSLESDIESTLGVRIKSDEPPVEVYILNDRQSFDHFLRFYYPELPPRRAFFLAQGSERLVFTFLGDRLEEDLRHEAAHALLNVAYGDLPLWLDEGLAEYFEGPNGQGLNSEHLGRLPSDLATGWTPDLAKLETLKSVREMTPRDYRESWAWVHHLLNGPPAGKLILLSYLAEDHNAPNAATLSTRLRGKDGVTARDLIAHLDRVRRAPAATASTAPASTVRLQNTTVDAPREPAPRRGFFTRICALFGL